jgi:hypothetical protein
MFIWAVGMTVVLLAVVGVRAGFVTEELKEEVRRLLVDQGKNSDEIEEMFYGSNGRMFVREGNAYENIVKLAKRLAPDSALLARQQRWDRYTRAVVIAGACVIAGSLVFDLLSRQ